MPSVYVKQMQAEKRHAREISREYKVMNTLRELFEKYSITDGLNGDWTVENWDKTDQNKFRKAMEQIGYKDSIYLFRTYKLPIH
jgi:uncharacterized protein YhfF